MIQQYAVTINFSWDGLVGREVYFSQAREARDARWEAHKYFTNDLYDHGAETYECGCCVSDERLKFLGMSVESLR